MTALAFRSLRISRETYGEKRLTATVEASLYSNGVTLNLDEEVANQVLAVVAPFIVKSMEQGLHDLHTQTTSFITGTQVVDATALPSPEGTSEPEDATHAAPFSPDEDNDMPF